MEDTHICSRRQDTEQLLITVNDWLSKVLRELLCMIVTVALAHIAFTARVGELGPCGTYLGWPCGDVTAATKQCLYCSRARSRR